MTIPKTAVNGLTGQEDDEGFCPYCGIVIKLDIDSLKAHAKTHGLPDDAWLGP